MLTIYCGSDIRFSHCKVKVFQMTKNMLCIPIQSQQACIF